jgi:hypothetical protein
MFTFAVLGIATAVSIFAVQTANAAPKRSQAECSKRVKNNPAYMSGSSKSFCGAPCAAAIRRCMNGEEV